MATDRRPDDSGPEQGSEDPSPSAAELDPEHDQTTSREAFELERAQQGRSDEAGRHGDHID